MSAEVSNYWFPAKRYGWGWGLPRRWQGWIVLVIYFAAVAFTTFTMPQPQFIISIAALSALLVAICWLKGEPPQWRWGGTEK